MDEFLSELEAQNKTLCQWAEERGFPLDVVYSVTRGKARGMRGHARQVFLAMGVMPAAMFPARRAA
jgi:gp16 family phage-associated protein